MFSFRHFAAPAVVGAALLLGGCASDHKDMPGNAQMMSEGRETVSATAPHDGTVYVYDDTSHKSVYTGRVVKGDNVRVDAKDNKVMLNDRTALDKDLVNDHRYQIYFDRDETRDPQNARYREGQTIITTPQGSSNAGGATIVQPNGTSTTVVPAQPSNSGSSTPSGATIVQPNSNGGTTVITPAPAR